jgi:hypothetical protein
MEIFLHRLKHPYKPLGHHQKRREEAEKEIAYLLLLAGVTDVQIDYSCYVGHHNELNGLIISDNALVARGVRDDWNMDVHPLWIILKQFNVPYSGSGGKNYAHASWVPRGEESLPKAWRIVLYFNVLKPLYESGELIKNM